MLQNSRFVSLFIVLAALAPGCSGSPAAPGDGAGALDGGAGVGASAPADGGFRSDGGGVPFESACEVLNAAECQYLQRCGVIGADEKALRECEVYQTVVHCGPTRWPARVRAGTLRYHARTAALCADAWQTRSCAQWQGEPKVCEDVTSPAAPLGGKCYGGLRTECLEGVCTGGTCPRTCRERGDPNDLCEETTDCKSGLYCRPTSSTSALGVCSTYGVSGDPCDANRICATGYVCGSFSTCEDAAKVGDACEPGDCAADAYCDVGTGYMGTCAARGNDGDACAHDEQCRIDLLCRSESGTCEPREDLSHADVCSRRQTCANEMTCVGTRVDEQTPPGLGTCLPGALAGAPCTSSWDCTEPLACAIGPDGGVCGPRLEDGSPCEAPRDCGVLSACIQGTCVRLPQPGEPCADGVCLYGVCESGEDGGLTCKGPGGPNAACTENDDCASLRCVSGRCLAACMP